MKKIIYLLIMSIVILAGCGNNEEETNSNNANELNIYGWAPTIESSYMDFFDEWATESLGYSVNTTTSSHNSNIQLITSLSGDNNFDLIYITQDEYLTLVEQGALLSINDIINNNVELQFLLELDYMQSLVVDGNIYAFPIYNPGFYAPIVREDWLEEFGMSMPTTLDQWELYFENCKEIKGAYGLSLNTLEFIQPFMSYFGLKEGVVYNEDGSYTVPYASDKATEALAWLQDMYSKGYINPNFETQSQTDVNEQFISGDTGCIVQNANTLPQINATGIEEGFSAQIAPPSKYFSYGEMELLAIPATANNVELVEEFMVLWYSEEGYNALKNGYEGYTYYIDENNNKVYTNEYEYYEKIMGSKVQVNPVYNEYNDTNLNEAYEIAGNSLTNVDKTVEWAEMSNIYQKYYAKVFKGELSPAEAIAQMQAEMLNIHSETLNVTFD